ncbi:hypothetical protein KCH_38510 [Kitasatospora cheerisanensis KCTC 2395]|uniref:Uncharacterized protein n=1 Tax=Kitasatospora cheerisanensis KCTC 2395 TaxID=1348663 RepID=A0A066Z1K2_9ACTN|nr:hypothetical protein KCH_38510 [Kitasatospora cheerisanensis KCTC 2395]
MEFPCAAESYVVQYDGRLRSAVSRALHNSPHHQQTSGLREVAVKGHER